MKKRRGVAGILQYGSALVLLSTALPTLAPTAPETAGPVFPSAFGEAAWRREPVEYVLALRRGLGLPTADATP